MVLFRCKDRDGVLISCSNEVWQTHIIDEHPEMIGCETYVKASIEQPYQICQDTTHIDRKVIYKPFILPKPYHTYYLRIVIEYKEKLFRGIRGYVVTAYPCTSRKTGEVVLWQK